MKISCFFPRLASKNETGLKRGCVVFSDLESAKVLRNSMPLRPFSLTEEKYDP
jgi:hypothetical protein